MPNDQNKMLAKLMHNAFGGKQNARVVEYLNVDETLRIPMLICPNNPSASFTTYATVGLSDYTNVQK